MEKILEKQTTVCLINDCGPPVNVSGAGALTLYRYMVAPKPSGWSNITMSLSRAVLISTLAVSLLGCATTSAPPSGSGAIARLSPEDLARLLPKPEPKLPLTEIIRLSKAGATAKEVIARIRETGSRYDLSASQAIELHAQGVSAEVLDHIQSARAQELRDRVAEEINQREQRHAEELRREQALRRDSPYFDPWWPGYPGWRHGDPFRPFGGFWIR